MPEENTFKIVATRSDGTIKEYFYNDILTTLDVKIFIDYASDWKTEIYEKIDDNWKELGSNK